MELFSPAEAADLQARFEAQPIAALLAEARARRAAGHGATVSYSRKVFIPLTQLCRDTCGYCTFARTPSRVDSSYLSPEQVLAIAQAGEHAGCREALFTLGDKPELRYAAARAALARLGFASTIDYLAAMCGLILRETGLLPHVNAGVMSGDEMATLRKVSVSQGLMLESVSRRLCERGGPHHGSPDKDPHVRLAMIDAAGQGQVPFTSGILIGIGETRRERIESLLALRALHARHGHLQEIIVQNFRAKPGTRMAQAGEPGLDDLLWTAAVARTIFPPAVNIQVPPNLSYGDFPRLLDAGINDWGGISPVTADHVNPEAPWPDLHRVEVATAQAGFALQQRLAIYPVYAREAPAWLDEGLCSRVSQSIDADGFAREESWSPGLDVAPPPTRYSSRDRPGLDALLVCAQFGARLSQAEIVKLFAARGGAVEAVCAAADELRARDER